jgi:hypothetical protein
MPPGLPAVAPEPAATAARQQQLSSLNESNSDATESARSTTTTSTGCLQSSSHGRAVVAAAFSNDMQPQVSSAAQAQPAAHQCCCQRSVQGPKQLRCCQHLSRAERHAIEAQQPGKPAAATSSSSSSRGSEHGISLWSFASRRTQSASWLLRRWRASDVVGSRHPEHESFQQVQSMWGPHLKAA